MQFLRKTGLPPLSCLIRGASLFPQRRVPLPALCAKVCFASEQIRLDRLKGYDPLLKFTVTLTEDRARAHAKEADREIAACRWGRMAPTERIVFPCRPLIRFTA